MECSTSLYGKMTHYLLRSSFANTTSTLPTLPTPTGQSATALPHTQSSTNKGVKMWMIVGIVVGYVLVIVILLLCCWRRRARHNVMLWGNIQSILGTDSTLVAPARHVAENRHSHPDILRDAEKGPRFRVDEVEATLDHDAEMDVLSPRSSLTLRPSDSASNVHGAPTSPTVNPRMLNELLAIRAKIKVLQEEERDLAELAR